MLIGGGHSQLVESKKSGNQVVYSNVIAHLLRNLEFVLKRSRTICAMTGLNIQFLSLFEYDVIIWHFFIRMLGYYCSNAVGRIVKIFPLLGEGLRERVYLEDRRRYDGRLFTVKGLFSNCLCLSSCSDITSSCKTQVVDGTATFPLSPLGRGLGRGAYQEGKLYSRRRIGCQEVKLLSVLRTKITSVTSLPSCHLTFRSSDCYPLPQSLPQGREAEKSTSRFTLHTSLKRAAFTLAEGATHVVHFDDIRRAAFTLAEVLITLGIIGVVAAMTMPVLIQNHREKVTVTQLKKTYSVLSQAMLMAVNENGTADMWDAYQSENDGDSEESVTRFTPVNLVKQLKVAKDCGFTSNGCFPAAEYKALNGAAERDFENLSRYYKIVLSDGTMLALEGYEPQKDVFDGVEDRAYGEIWVDTNGKKFPNKVGKDLFLFLYKKDRILPYGYNNTDKPLSSTGCSTAGTGYNCTAWVLYNENMDYLHCDDLSWTGKRQCK